MSDADRPTDIRRLSRIRVDDERTPPTGRPTDIRRLSRIRVDEDAPKPQRRREQADDDAEPPSSPARRRTIAAILGVDPAELDQTKGRGRRGRTAPDGRKRSIAELASQPVPEGE
jgi:hypothetical protein